MEEQSRPLDALNRARNKRVAIDLKSGCQVSGVLRAFDIHINIVLDDAEEMKDGELKRKLGNVFIRGDQIIMINPSK